jgi:hypothetical protein
MKAISNNMLQSWAYKRNGEPYACGGEKIEVHVDTSNHIVSTRLECPEAGDWKTEGYFENDNVLQLVRTISRNGTETPQRQRFTRLSKPKQCPRH